MAQFKDNREAIKGVKSFLAKKHRVKPEVIVATHSDGFSLFQTKDPAKVRTSFKYVIPHTLVGKKGEVDLKADGIERYKHKTSYGVDEKGEFVWKPIKAEAAAE
jgi:hypothetical protein